MSATSMLDHNFNRTVIFMIEHGSEGAVGVVINRPLDLAVADAVPDWAGRVVEPAVIFSGGPVAQGSAIALGRVDDADHERVIIDGVAVVDLAVEPALQPQAGSVRIFSGYSGWDGGQLEGELALDAWHVFPALSRDVLGPDPDALWSDVLRRQGGDFELLADYPDAPWLN